MVNRRLFWLVTACLCLLGSVWLVVSAGLPQRAAFTGQFTGELEIGQRPIAPEIGAQAPSFSAPTLDAGSLTLSALQGEPVILNFWATWCVPCRVEMPELQQLYNQYQDAGLHVVAINMGETQTAIDRWVAEFDLTFDVVLDENQALPALYHLRGQPSTYVIAPDGVITHIFYGPTTAEALERALAPYLPT